MSFLSSLLQVGLGEVTAGKRKEIKENDVMAHGIGTIHVRQEHGKTTVIGMGKTARGQKYIKETTPLTVKSIADPKFKEELKIAVEQMYG